MAWKADTRVSDQDWKQGLWISVAPFPSEHIHAVETVRQKSKNNFHGNKFCPISDRAEDPA